MNNHGLHFEPYVQVLELTSTTATIGWGGFYFRRSLLGNKWKLIRDNQLKKYGIARTQTIGLSAEAYGSARINVYDQSRLVVTVPVNGCNYACISGLLPDTLYYYEILVDGRPFIPEILHDCDFSPEGRALGLQPSRQKYRLQFRTFPSRDSLQPLALAAFGDFGVGIYRFASGYRQRTIARALELALDAYDLRLALVTGDNIYRDLLRRIGTGSEDHDWFYTFYQPYRYLLSRIPFYPTVGNHDCNDSDNPTDRIQLLDNYYIGCRFRGPGSGEIAPPEFGLSYRFRFGGMADFLCLDTSWNEELNCRFVELPGQQQFLQESLADSCASGVRWQLLFAHHAPYCAGPRYVNDPALLRSVVPLLRRYAEKDMHCITLSGNEHNFQYSHADGVDYFNTGAAGRLRLEPPHSFSTARTRAWAAAPHFLLLELSAESVEATPLTMVSGQRLLPVHLRDQRGNTVRAPIRIDRKGRI